MTKGDHSLCNEHTEVPVIREGIRFNVMSSLKVWAAKKQVVA